MLAKGDFKGKGLEASEVALTQSTKAPTKDIIVIKSNFLFFFNFVFVSRICNQFDLL